MCNMVRRDGNLSRTVAWSWEKTAKGLWASKSLIHPKMTMRPKGMWKISHNSETTGPELRVPTSIPFLQLCSPSLFDKQATSPHSQRRKEGEEDHTESQIEENCKSGLQHQAPEHTHYHFLMSWQWIKSLGLGQWTQSLTNHLPLPCFQ